MALYCSIPPTLTVAAAGATLRLVATAALTVKAMLPLVLALELARLGR